MQGDPLRRHVMDFQHTVGYAVFFGIARDSHLPSFWDALLLGNSGSQLLAMADPYCLVMAERGAVCQSDTRAVPQDEHRACRGVGSLKARPQLMLHRISAALIMLSLSMILFLELN